jgi:hypothetical protein
MRRSITDDIHSITSMARGLEKNDKRRSFVLNGAHFKTSDLLARSRRVVAANKAAFEARGIYLQRVKEAKALLDETRSVFRDLRAALWMRSGDHPEQLADYGLSPRRPTGTTSPSVLAAAADKRRATRKARHTMGKKQKKKIKGAKAAPPPSPTS